MSGYGELAQIALNLFMVVPRIAGAFLVLPVITSDTMPAMARNSFFVALALVAIPFATATAPINTGSASWVLTIAKEGMVGVMVGFVYSLGFWAIAAVGDLIDTKVGSTMASVVDPLSGHQTSLNGAFLSRMVAWMFMATGGFTLFLDLLFSSYRVWPIDAPLPDLAKHGPVIFTEGFTSLITWTLMLAAPVLVLLTLIDVAFGLMNRYAQQLNVYSLSMSVKSWVAQWIVLVMIGVIVEFMLAQIERTHGLLDLLRRGL